jgi:uncharacterized membrane protein YbaN (DUF454 family)
MKWIWNILGFLSITAGILGLFLPVLPTTPFVLLAAACFAKGSTRFYNKLISNEMFGEMVRDFQKGLGIKKHIKVKAITLLWLSLLFSSYLLDFLIWLTALLIFVGLCVSKYILSLPTRR